MDVQNLRQTLTATISTGATGLSNIVDLQGYRVAAVDMSTAWTNAVLTFQGSNDGVTLQNLYDENYSELTWTSTAATNIVPGSASSLALAAHRYLAIRSGTSAIPVAQAASRAITLVLVPA